MTFLLDTNVLSELSKDPPDAVCEAWLEAYQAECSLASVTLAELRYGIERLAEGKKKSRMERDFNNMVEDYRTRFFEFDGPAAFEWGRYAAELEAHYGSDWWKQFDLRDTQIAAIAREYGLTVVTRNTKHFPFCAQVDPFDAKNLSR